VTHPSQAPIAAVCPSCGRKILTRITPDVKVRIRRHDTKPNGPSCTGTGAEIPT
jgi:hypothetical protein